MAASAPSGADIDAIVVAHNSGDFLLACVQSILRSIPPDRVHVIDVESSDDSIVGLSAAGSDIDVRRTENRGFAAGNNVGIRATTGEFVLLLNPDAELEPGALDALLARARSSSDIGIVGARVLTASGVTQEAAWGDDPGLVTALRARLGRLRSRQVRVPPRATDVDWVTGACMLVRREAIDAAGYLDEGYFLYFEDVDWCVAMRTAGWRVVLEPDARVTHHAGSSGGGSSSGLRAYRESFWRYCSKHGLHVYPMAVRVWLGFRSVLGGRS